MIITLDEPNSNGFLNVTFQAIFMDGPFRIVVDDFLETFIDYENNGFHTIQIEYLSGSHEIIIKSKFHIKMKIKLNISQVYKFNKILII